MALVRIPPQGISLDGLTWEGGQEVDMRDDAWLRRLMDAGAIVLSGFEGMEPGPGAPPVPGTIAAQQGRVYVRK